jgi:hypothetical protein
MPLRFRCGYCSRLLGIARRKAGSNTTCPHCGATIAVPMPEEYEEGPESPQDLADIDRLLKAERAVAAPAPAPARPPVPSAAGTTTPTPTTTPATPRPGVARPPVAVEPLPLTAEEPPLLHRDIDSVLGAKPATPPPTPAASTAPEPLSLEPDARTYVLNSRQMTALVVGVVGLVALAFAAGYMIGAR